MLVAVACFVRSSQSRFTIYSDSVSAIQSVCNNFSTHPLVNQIHLWLTLLKNKHKRVTFCWVPSHIRVVGNEAADRAAREAHDPIHDTPLPYRNYFPYYQRRLLDGWQSEWDCAYHNNKLRSVKRSVRPWSTSSRESRHESVIITRFRTYRSYPTNTWTFTSWWGSTILWGLHRTTDCGNLLTECPEYFEQRRQCFGGAGICDPIEMSHVLRDDDTAVQQVLRYLHLTGLYNAI